MNEKLSVHFHHKRTDDVDEQPECLGRADLAPGEAMGGELAGGLFYVGRCCDGELIVTFSNTCYPTGIELGELGGDEETEVPGEKLELELSDEERQLEKARVAVMHVLQLIRTNKAVRYQLGFGTQSFHLLTEAAATFLDEPLEQIQSHYLGVTDVSTGQ